MVWPSRACLTCKRRRIKCDIVYPLCTRCKKANRDCTWDPEDDLQGLPFKSENTFAQGRARRPRKKKELEFVSNAAPPATEQPTRLDEVNGFSPISPPIKIEAALSIPILDHSINYWATRWTFKASDLPDMGHEYGVYVLELWQRSRAESSLNLALCALTQAVFGHAKHSDRAIKDANKAYMFCIERTRREVAAKPSGESIDQLLFAVMLMGSFENVMYEKFSLTHGTRHPDAVGSRFWKCFCHHHGALSLLQLRRQMGLTMCTALHKVVRRQIIRSSILRGNHVPEWLRDGGEYGEEGPMRDLDSLLVRVASLRANSLDLSASTSLSGGAEQRSTTLSLVADAQNLDADLTRWEEDFSEKVESFEIPRGSEYAFHGYGAAWGRFCALRLIVNSICIRALRKLVHTNELSAGFYRAQETACEQIMGPVALKLCEVVSPFFHPTQMQVHEIQTPESTASKMDDEIIPKLAVLIAWPLAVAVSTEFVPDHYRTVLKQRLCTVACSLGDSILRSVVDNEGFRF